MNGNSFAAGIIIGMFFAGIALVILLLATIYMPGEGKFYYPWHETKAICVQAEKQNCKVEYKQVYVAENRRYDYEQ